MTARHQRKTPATKPADASQPIDNTVTAPADQPRFAQPEVKSVPPRYVVKHGSDAAAYKVLDEESRASELQPLPFPPSRGGTEPVLTMAELYGQSGAALAAAVEKAGRLVFHAVGDTGNVHGPELQARVTDKMVADFTDAAEVQPRFFFHLGDVVYNFGEAAYYYDQFYDSYRNYPAPILGLAGNHDGLVAPNVSVPSLEAYLRNFCAERFAHTPESGGLDRTAQVQPGVYYTFEAPLLRILALYSGTLEDPGVIAAIDGRFADLGDAQLAFLEAALTRARDEKYEGALILAHHHPAYTLAGERGHGSSTLMRRQIDAICDRVGLWPHAVLSAHAHNYQRYTRRRGAFETPYVIAGNGGHSRPQKLTRMIDPPLRTPLAIPTDEDKVVLENYDQTDNGYLRLIVTPTQLRIEYHPASDGDESKTPDDSVTVDLATRTLGHFAG